MKKCREVVWAGDANGSKASIVEAACCPKCPLSRCERAPQKARKPELALSPQSCYPRSSCPSRTCARTTSTATPCTRRSCSTQRTTRAARRSTCPSCKHGRPSHRRTCSFLATARRTARGWEPTMPSCSSCPRRRGSHESPAHPLARRLCFRRPRRRHGNLQPG